MSQRKDPNQGEGDRASARRYGGHVREFIDKGKVPDAAAEARRFVERDPEEANAAEQAARRGPAGRGVSVDDLVAKGQSLIDRVRPLVGKLRNRFWKQRENH